MKRREFLTATSTFAAASAVGYHGFGAEDSETVNFALVGLGKLATNQLAPALQKTKHAKLKGIVTGTPAKEAIWMDKYGIDRRHVYNYENYDKIAQDEEIDVIYIVLPNGMHHEYTIRAAAAGKHVLCEKPMANSAQECREMIQACEKADRKLAIGYRCQFEPHHQHCIELARQETFGDFKMVEAGFGFKIGDPTQWRLRKGLAGGGALMDVGIYALQACRYITGKEPLSITAQETKTDPKKFAEVDETIAWTMEMDGGAVCVCDTTYNFNGVNRFRAYADEGWFGLQPAFGYGGIRGETSEGAIQMEQVDHFAAEMDAFAKHLLFDEPNRVPGEEGLRDLNAIEAIYRSISSGKLQPVAAV